MKTQMTMMLLTTLVIAGCECGGKKTSTNDNDPVANTSAAKARSSGLAVPAAGTIVYETLDGTPMDTAKKMIGYFENRVVTEKYPIKSYFIKKDMLMLINNMLAKEIAATLPGGRHYPTDGVRIYFAKERPNSTDLKLILVSTTDSTYYAAVGENRHHDYYDHLGSDLHKPTVTLNIAPEPEYLDGALLRKPCKNCDVEPSCEGVNRPGAILRSYAEKMVKNFTGQVMETKAVWFDAARLSRLTKGKSFAGLRIYLATYPDNQYLANGKSTFTLTTVDDTGKDYFYCESDASAHKIAGKKTEKWAPLWGPPYNNGSLCPYNCN